MTGVLELIFNPRRVAVVGASDRPGKMGTTFMRNLATFAGEVVPVTRSQETVDGRKAYRRLQDIPGGVDLAVLVVPAAAVPGVMADAAAAGAGAAIVISGGFAEAGPEGAALQRAAVEAAHAGGVRVVGPNCFGVQNCNAGLNASMATGTPPAGGDIGDAEVLEYLGADPESSVVCCFLESLDEGRAFYERARAITARKPIIVAKTGRSEGRQLPHRRPGRQRPGLGCGLPAGGRGGGPQRPGDGRCRQGPGLAARPGGAAGR